MELYKSPIGLLEEKTQRYIKKMPYIKALILSDQLNDIEIYRFLNTQDIFFRERDQNNEDDLQIENPELSDNFLNGLRSGMNELFTDFKKQFEKLQTSKNLDKQKDNYQVSIMFDKYYLRKKEIIENVLMIVICDVERDGITMEQAINISKEQDPKIKENLIDNNSTFNTGDVDILFQDF